MKILPLLPLILLTFASLSTVSRGVTAPPEQPPVVEAPKGVNPKLTSTDPDYGYTKEKPVKVGGKTGDDGPAAERAYFSSLRDEAGKPLTFHRIGSFGAGPDGNILDGYECTTSTGRKLTIYIDMYHLKKDPLKQLAPKGLFKAK